MNFQTTLNPSYYPGEFQAIHPASKILSPEKTKEALPGYSEEAINALLDVDRGSPGKNMKTLGLSIGVKNTETYQLTAAGIQLSRELFPIDLEAKASNPRDVEVPNFLEVKAIWDKSPDLSGAGNNILGENGVLFLNEPEIQIPIVKATDPLLAYYGATLINPGDAICFPGSVFPLFYMEIGQDYFRDFVHSENGGGVYLEYHNDQPHFHMPIEGGGYYILARWKDETHLHITGFEIPDKHAVYTKKGAIHCDAGLTGQLIVGYTIAEDFSTVLLRSGAEKTMTQVTFN